MKSLLRTYLFSFFSVWILDTIVPGFILGLTLQDLALTSLALLLVTYIVVPLLSIVFLPINIITIGLFKWVLIAAATWAIVNYLPFIQLNDWRFDGITLSVPYLAMLPPLYLKPFEFKLWENIVLLSISYNLLYALLNWVTRTSE